MKKTQILGYASAGILLAISGLGAGCNRTNSEKGECHGVNECKGKGACGGVHPDGTKYDCAGKNTCKGLGWLELTEKECNDKKGTFKKKA